MKKKVIEYTVVLIIMFGVFYMGHKYANDSIEPERTTRIIKDTIFVEKSGTIDTLWITNTRVDTIVVIDNSNIDSIETIRIDTVFMKQPQLIAKIDTSFTSKDSLVTSDVSVRYNITTNKFWIRNTIAHEITKIKPIQERKHLDGIICAFGNNNSLELGFGGIWWINNRVGLGLGYTTQDKYLLYFSLNLF